MTSAADACPASGDSPGLSGTSSPLWPPTRWLGPSRGRSRAARTGPYDDSVPCRLRLRQARQGADLLLPGVAGCALVARARGVPGGRPGFGCRVTSLGGAVEATSRFFCVSWVGTSFTGSVKRISSWRKPGLGFCCRVVAVSGLLGWGFLLVRQDRAGRWGPSAAPDPGRGDPGRASAGRGRRTCACDEGLLELSSAGCWPEPGGVPPTRGRTRWRRRASPWSPRRCSRRSRGCSCRRRGRGRRSGPG